MRKNCRVTWIKAGTREVRRPILFDDLFFPANVLPNGEACANFTLPGDPERGHLIWTEPFAPRLRRKPELAAGELGLEGRCWAGP